MPYKDKNKQKEYSKKYGEKYYLRNKQDIIEKNRINRKKHREKWREFKKTLSCEKCGLSHPATIDFHHPLNSGETKVSFYVQQNQWKRAYEEVAKCQVLCANCHRILHYEERFEK